MAKEALSEQDVKNLLQENEELKDQLDVMKFRHQSLKEQNQFLQSGMKMAGMDQLPRDVMESARMRMLNGGLREDQAIDCALRQYHNDVNLARAAQGQKPSEDPEAMAKQAAQEERVKAEAAYLEKSRAERKK